MTAENSGFTFTPQSGDLNPPQFKITSSSHPIADPLAAEPNYWNHDVFMGWNVVGGDRIDNTKPACWLAMESKFWSANTFAFEFHIQGKDISGGSHRWLSFFLPHGSDQSASGMATKLAYISVADTENNERFRFNTTGHTAEMALKRARIFATTNNVAFLRQMNAAGTAPIDLMRIDNMDRAVMGAPVAINTPKVEPERKSVVPLHLGSGKHGDTFIHMACGSVVEGDIKNVVCHPNATGYVETDIANNNTTSGGVAQSLRVNRGAGDALTTY
jgi:hypothetical protein